MHDPPYEHPPPPASILDCRNRVFYFIFEKYVTLLCIPDVLVDCF
jgi:hypothetical protein